MEVTALKGSSGDVQHFADRIIAERGVRYGRVAMIPTSAKTKRPPEGILDDRDAGGRMSVPGSFATEMRCPRRVRFPPNRYSNIAPQQLKQCAKVAPREGARELLWWVPPV